MSSINTEFIDDRLVKTNQFIRLFKQGLGYIDPDDWKDDYYISRCEDIYSKAYKFFSLIDHEYDNAELLFIANLIYNAAGISDAIKLLDKFFPITITVNKTLKNEIKKIYNYTITISSDKECFINVELALLAFKDLIKDVLFYKDSDISFGNIYLASDLINEIPKIDTLDTELFIDRYYTKDSNHVTGTK